MSKKHKKHEEHVDESWLIPYADILTLLLALFIVLFASSTVDETKYEQMMTTFNELFTGGTGVIDYQAPIHDEFNPLEDIELREINQTAFAQEMENLREMQREINSYIQEKNLSEQLDTELTKNGLMITILDDALFDSGKADIKPESEKLAKEISKLLVSDPPRQIVISGHTDNVPIQTAEFRSNWDLSAMRAINFLKIIIENNTLNPSYFNASGHGQFQPVADNNSEIGRSKNRRVEVLILPNISYEE